jgi:predicted Zn-dependent protease
MSRTMSTPFVTDARVALPALQHASGCRCALHARRLFTGGLLAGAAMPGAFAREGVEVARPSSFSKLISADTVEQSAAQQYAQMTREAAQQKALGPETHPQVVRLRYIANRIIPHTYEWNARARQWKWEVNLIGSKQINAFCMPGGKIAFYYGILDQLKLNDDEVAMIMGHEAAHALREHAREQMGKSATTQVGAGLLSALLGLGGLGDAVVRGAANLLTLKFGREDESEADLIGIDLAARAGYDPGAGVTLWQKMAQASKGAPPAFLSTHPTGPTRIHDIELNLPKVRPLFARAEKPGERFAPPATGSS